MKTLGIDIGTTTISAAVLEDGQFLASETRANGAFIPSALTCAREQDVEKITQTALAIVQMLFERYPDIHSIGVTGQMHGILYVDADGNAVSPLYTWQDARGSLPHSKTESWVQYLTRDRMPCRSRFRSGNARVQPCRRTCAARRRHLLHHR